MPEIRYAHTVDELNGKIYIVGGINTETSTYPTTALVFDRSSGVWSQIPLLNNKTRAMHSSCIVGNKLYVVGGSTSSDTKSLDMFDPNTGQWISKNPMPTERGLAACAAIDGKIYVIGGIQNYQYDGLKTVEVYDTNTGNWTQLTDMPTKRWGCSAVVYNGKIYVFGGVTFFPTTVYSSIEVYDPQANTWNTTATLTPMPTARYCLTTCLLDSNIYAIGGWYHSSNGPIYDKVEVYNPESNEWYNETSIPVALCTPNIVLDGKIYIYGGTYTTHPNIGTSAIYELSYDDIFAQQPYVDKPYARKNLDSVLFRTRFSNLYNHQFEPHLICANSDSTQMDSLSLFDDGLHGDSLINDGLYGTYILPRQTEDFFTLSVSTIDNQTNKYYNTPGRCKFTTAGPVILDSIPFGVVPGFKFGFKPYLKNIGTVKIINTIKLKLSSNDSWINNITPAERNYSNMLPGQTVGGTQIFTVAYDTANFRGHFNLKFEISSDDFIYWIIDATIIVNPTEVEHESLPLLVYKLEQNYPNPFNPTTKISWQLPVSGWQTLKVYDVLGNEVATLVNEYRPAGSYEVEFDASNLSSGVYFYQLKAGSFIEAKKMILLR